MSTAAPAASRQLFRAALLLFTITIVIGILNGIDAVDFGRETLLTHVHAGTLGWITLAVLGAGMWMFAGSQRGDAGADKVALGAIAATGLYVAAFWGAASSSAVRNLRPVAGTLMLVAIVYGFAWLWQRRGAVNEDAAKVALLLAMVSLTIGAVFGILLGMAVTGRFDWIPNSVAEAHPPTMVIGYLILAGMAIAEWRLHPDPADRRSRAGLAQAWLLFAAGMALLLGFVFESTPLLILNAPLEIAGIAIFVGRLRRPLLAARPTRTGTRHFDAVAVAFLVFNVAVLVALIGKYADAPDDIPLNLILMLDHIMFVGVMTNLLIGLVMDAGRGLSGWVSPAVFWGMNGGLVLFALGLARESAILKRAGTPVLGVALLLAIATLTEALRGGAPAPAEAHDVAPVG